MAPKAALESVALRNVIVSTLANTTSKTTAFARIVSAIESHVNSTMGIVGTYSGVIAGPNPDPANGSKTWKTRATLSMDAAALEAAPQGSTAQASAQSSFTAAMQVELRKANASGFDDTSTVSLDAPAALSTLTFSYDMEAAPNNLTDAWGIIASAIVSSLTSSLPAPAAASSIFGGTGTVTFTSVA